MEEITKLYEDNIKQMDEMEDLLHKINELMADINQQIANALNN